MRMNTSFSFIETLNLLNTIPHSSCKKAIKKIGNQKELIKLKLIVFIGYSVGQKQA